MALESTSLFLKVGEFGFKKEREEKRKPKKLKKNFYEGQIGHVVLAVAKSR